MKETTLNFSKKCLVKGGHYTKLSYFFLQLSLLMKSGKTLAESLSIFSTTSEALPFVSVFETLSIDIDSGIAFYSSLEKFPYLFDKNTILFIKSLEAHHKIDEQCLLIVSNWLKCTGRVTELFKTFFKILFVHLDIFIAYVLFVFLFLTPIMINMPGFQDFAFTLHSFLPLSMLWISHILLKFQIIILPLYLLLISCFGYLYFRYKKDINRLFPLISNIPLLKKYVINGEYAITSNIFLSLVKGKILSEKLFMALSQNTSIAQVIYKSYQQKITSDSIDTNDPKFELELSSIDTLETNLKRINYITKAVIYVSSVMLLFLFVAAEFAPKFGF